MELSEKAVSKKQQRFFGMVRAAQKGEGAASPEVAQVAADISKKDAKDFASTKHKGLPEKKKKEVSEALSVKDSKKLAKASVLSTSDDPKKQDRARARQVDVDYKDLIRQRKNKKVGVGKSMRTEGSEHTQWSASIMLPSKRRKFVVVSCPSRDRKDAIQIIKALYGTDDIKQLNRIGIRTEGVALGKTRSTDTNPKGWKARVSSGRGMTLTKAGGLGKSKPKGDDAERIKRYKAQVRSDRIAAAKERRISEGAIDMVRKYYGKKKTKKHVYPPGASGGDAGQKAADVVRDKEHKKYVNFLPSNK